MTRTARLILPPVCALIVATVAGGAETPKAPAAPPVKEIRWRAFEPASFAAAREEGKLVLLSIQSPWGHWDRVMTEITYADPRVISLLNERFVPIRVDSLMRPDIDGRYGVGGTPTTTFLLHTGQPFYFPDSSGKVVRAGGGYYSAEAMTLYLNELADYYAANKEKADRAADDIATKLLARKEVGTGELKPDILEVAVTRMLEGFGDWRPDPDVKRARTPDSDSVLLAMHYFVTTGDRKVLDRGLHMLTDMARGGIRDQIGGGFHRLAYDAAWRVPAFEKTLQTNAEMLESYLWANRLTLSGRFRAIAEETAAYVLGTLTDPEGWFYAYQKADARLGEDGDYYTWTLDEATEALDEEERKLMLPAFDIGEWGEMVDSAPRRNVLFLVEGPPLLASRLGMEEPKAKEIFEAGRKKLLEARSRRAAPEVGKLSVTEAGAEMAASLILAGDAWRRPELAAAGLKALDLMWDRARDPNSGLMDHAWSPDSGRAGLPIFFADQAQTARALVAAFESTGDVKYLDRCRQLADAAAAAFANTLGGGYMDRIFQADAPGILSWPVRSIRDNSIFAETLLRLRKLSGRAEDDKYEKLARKTLESWADEYAQYRQACSPYGIAAHRFQTPPVEVMLLGTPADAGYDALRARALAIYHPWKVVRRLSPQEAEKDLSARHVTTPPPSGASVIFCRETRCAGPFTGTENLALKLDEFLNKSGAAAAPAPAGDEKEKEN